MSSEITDMRVSLQVTVDLVVEVAVLVVAKLGSAQENGTESTTGASILM